jgi:hypothetical protein
MTPLGRFLAHKLPRILWVPVLALLYTAMASAILVASRNDLARIIYVDIRAGNNAH